MRDASPFNVRCKYNCLISFSSRLGSPGYMEEPPDSTMCLYKSCRKSMSAAWIVLYNNSSDTCDYLPRHQTCNAHRLHIHQIGLKHGFWRFKPLRSHFNNSTIGKLTKVLVRRTLQLSIPYNSQPIRSFQLPAAFPTPNRTQRNIKILWSGALSQSLRYDWMRNRVAIKVESNNGWHHVPPRPVGESSEAGRSLQTPGQYASHRLLNPPPHPSTALEYKIKNNMKQTHLAK